MVRILLASLLSALALFVWGFLFWAALPLPFLFLKAPNNESEILDVLKKAQLASGDYVIPWPNEAQRGGKTDKEMEQELMARHKQGPLVHIMYRADGVDVENPTVFAIGFVHFFVVSLLLAVLLKMALPGLPSYGARVLFVFIAGLFAAVTIDAAQPIWFHHPPLYPLFSGLFHVGIGLLAGLVLGALVKPQS